jgi:hypothetical protein
MREPWTTEKHSRHLRGSTAALTRTGRTQSGTLCYPVGWFFSLPSQYKVNKDNIFPLVLAPPFYTDIANCYAMLVLMKFTQRYGFAALSGIEGDKK